MYNKFFQPISQSEKSTCHPLFPFLVQINLFSHFMWPKLLSLEFLAAKKMCGLLWGGKGVPSSANPQSKTLVLPHQTPQTWRTSCTENDIFCPAKFSMRNTWITVFNPNRAGPEYISVSSLMTHQASLLFIFPAVLCATRNMVQKKSGNKHIIFYQDKARFVQQSHKIGASQP